MKHLTINDIAAALKTAFPKNQVQVWDSVIHLAFLPQCTVNRHLPKDVVYIIRIMSVETPHFLFDSVIDCMSYEDNPSSRTSPVVTAVMGAVSNIYSSTYSQKLNQLGCTVCGFMVSADDKVLAGDLESNIVTVVENTVPVTLTGALPTDKSVETLIDIVKLIIEIDQVELVNAAETDLDVQINDKVVTVNGEVAEVIAEIPLEK